MRHGRVWILSLVAAMGSFRGAADGQVGPAANAGTIETAQVGADEAVITMDGFCGTDPSASPKAPCRTVITRSEFEKLAGATGASSGPAAKAQFAAFYVQFSLWAREAQKRGMDKDPLFQRRLELARIQLLGQALLQDLQAKSVQFAPGELEKFFHDNPARFEQATLQRVYIPKTKFKELPNGIQQPVPESAPEMKVVAEAIYARARAGGDFEQLQKEALDSASLKEEMTATLGAMPRDHLRRSQQGVFDLKPGQVSALFEDSDEGYYIYKKVSAELPAFESVKSEVEAALQKQRMDTWKKDITEPAKVSLNEQYFGTAGVESGPGH